jgi:hypothetical protein
MKVIAIFIFICSSLQVFAQSPSSMNYQAVARDGNDDLVVNQSISVRISIIQGSVFGASIYVETHTPTTNDNGLFSLKIGQGSASYGAFSAINWGTGVYFMKSELDLNGGSNYLTFGTSQFLSVPYAFYADSTGNVNDADSNPTNELNQGISLAGTLLSITDAGGVVTQDLVSIQDGFTDADADSTNELNQGISLAGTLLSITDAGGVVTQDLVSIQDGFTDADADSTNELNQSISLAGTLLSITDAGGVVTQDLGAIAQWDTAGTSIYNKNIGNVGIGLVTPNSKLHIKQDSISHGLLIEKSKTLSATDSSAVKINNFSAAAGQTVIMNDTLTYSPAIEISHKGYGSPLQAYITNKSNPYAGLYVNHGGIGSGLHIKNTRSDTNALRTDYYPLLNLYQNGKGSYGRGINLNMSDSSTGTGMMLRHNGHDPVRASYGWPSRGLEVDIMDTNNRAIGLSVFSYGKGLGQYIRMFEDNGGALGILQEGTGNGIFINLMDTSSFSNSININHSAKGNAIEAYSYGNSTSVRGTVFNPYSATSAAIVGIASNGNDGVGVEGAGGRYGIHAIATNSNTNTYGVYAQGDLAATGVKSFVVDHPTDPTNKVLRHYSVESNEVLNMYRGIAKFDSLGFCKIELPNYWDAANTNPSYQLTAIGTPEQPYIYKEIEDNYFIISGKPFTKVSWTVYSNRNDPTFRYYDSHGKNYSNEEFDKLDSEKGSYYVPEAFGKPSLFKMPEKPIEDTDIPGASPAPIDRLK